MADLHELDAFFVVFDEVFKRKLIRAHFIDDGFEALDGGFESGGGIGDDFRWHRKRGGSVWGG